MDLASRGDGAGTARYGAGGPRLSRIVRASCVRCRSAWHDTANMYYSWKISQANLLICYAGLNCRPERQGTQGRATRACSLGALSEHLHETRPLASSTAVPAGVESNTAGSRRAAGFSLHWPERKYSKLGGKSNGAVAVGGGWSSCV